MQAQLIINQKLFQKQTNTINKHRTKCAIIDVREKKMFAKLIKMIQKLNAYKEEDFQKNVIDTNAAATLSFALKNLDIDTINLIFQDELIEIVLLINEEKFFNVFVFLKVKLDE